MTIFGLGISGIYALRFLKEKGYELFVVDRRPKSEWDEEVFKYVARENSFEEKELSVIPPSDKVILSPGIPRNHPLLKNMSDEDIISECELALEETDIPVVAITGTNGKTTTTTMMGIAFEKAGLNPFVGGNIGLPVVASLMDTKRYGVLILELSSFQLESTPSLKPSVGVILNISDNHGERYEKFEDYKKAKLNIFNKVSESTTAIIAEELDSEVNVKKKILLSKTHIKEVMNSFDYSKSKLVGDHNKENLFVVLKTLEAMKINDAKKIVQELINEFKGVHFRLEYLGENNDFLFYNDAKSTNTFATVTALKGVSELGLKTRLILGGKLRNNQVHLKDELLPYKKHLSKIYLIGEASELLFQDLKNDFEVEKMNALKNIFENLEKSRDQEVILFSPAFPSFDQYANYVKRGEDFDDLTKTYLKSCE